MSHCLCWWPRLKYLVQIESGKKPPEEVWTMPKKRYSVEEIIQRLRGVDVLLSQGRAIRQAYGPRLRVDESALTGSIVRLADHGLI